MTFFLAFVPCPQTLLTPTPPSHPAPTVLQCSLQTLVGVYRKLGYFNAISGSSAPAVTKSSWASGAGGGTPGNSANQVVSWSERAGQDVGNTFRTPEASPQGSARLTKEADVPWSERRVASPLVEEKNGWKVPLERKKRKMKKASEVGVAGNLDEATGPERSDCEVNVKGEGEESGEVMGVIASGAFGRGGAENGDDDDEGPDEQERGDDSGSETKKREDEDQEVRGAIGMRQSQEGNSRVSCGFSPQMRDEDEDMEEGEEDDREEKEDAKEKQCGEDRKGRDSRGGAGDARKDEEEAMKLEGSEPRLQKDCGTSESSRVVTASNMEAVISSGTQEKEETVEAKLDNEEGEKGDDGEEDALGQSVGIHDKYQGLHDILREFLTDFLSGLTADLPLNSLMSYLNSSRRETEVKALVRCVSRESSAATSSADVRLDPQHPLHKLMELCEHFKATRLLNVLTHCVDKLI